MSTDYVKRVALAYGQDDPDLDVIVDRARAEIEMRMAGLREEINELTGQLVVIQQLVARVPQRQPTLPAAAPQPEGQDDGQGGDGRLSDELKTRVRDLYLAERVRSGTELTAQEVVDRLRAEGTVFPVAQPVPSVGTVLRSVRRALRPHVTAEAASP